VLGIGTGTGTVLGLRGVEFVRVEPATLEPRGAVRLLVDVTLLRLLAVLIVVKSRRRGKLTGGADIRFLAAPSDGVPEAGPEPDMLNLLGFKEADTEGTATGVSRGAAEAGVERIESTMEDILDWPWMRTVSEPLSDAVE